jgi:putative membrane protein
MSLTFNNISKRFPALERKIRGFLITLYVVGVIGSTLPFTRELFIILTPFILLISFITLLIFHTPGFDAKISLLFLLIFLVSFSVEVEGVSTGVIFGSYTYGKGLGIKVFETPLMIGLNWVLLVYCTYVIFEKIPVGIIGKIIGASLLMVIYDLVMEQVAPKLDMWVFDGGFAPPRNYISWFLLALLFHSVLRLAGVRIKNRLAPLIFICQGIFFILLFIIFKFAE